MKCHHVTYYSSCKKKWLHFSWPCLSMWTLQQQQVGDLSPLIIINKYILGMYCISSRRTCCCIQSQQGNLVHIQTPLVSELFSPWFLFWLHYQTGFYFVLDWTKVVWSLYSGCLFLASVVARSAHNHVSLCRPTLPAERGLSPSTVPGPELAHTHLMHTHTHTHPIFISSI